ncbi:hypothetical protein B9G55_16995 [Saccharibacillus sp. O16]|nr:hypothetical protein B9G55_16995 [Saccharibacillus sp. O16]
MGRIAQIGQWPDYRDTQTLQECEEVLGSLPELERISEREWRYELGDREMKIELKQAGLWTSGEASEQDSSGEEQRLPSSDVRFNALYTEVPQAALRVRGGIWSYTQLRLKLASLLGWEVVYQESAEHHRPADRADAAPLPALSDVNAKGTVAVKVFSWREAYPTVHYRPKAKLTAKVQPRASYSALVALDEDRVLHGYKGGSYVTSIPGIQLRTGQSLDCVEELTGCGRTIALHEDRQLLLADGPLSQGYRAHIVVCSLSPLSVRNEVPLPLSPPFAWVPGSETFLAAVPNRNISDQDYPYSAPSARVGGTRLLISDEAVDGHPWLRDALDLSQNRLIEVNLRTQSWKTVISQAAMTQGFSPYPSSTINKFVQSPDARWLYITDGYHRVACFDRAESAFVWNVNLHESMRVYDLALSPCGKYLAVVGLASDAPSAQSLSLLHAAQGDYVYRLPLYDTFSSAAYTVVWHPDGRYMAVGLANGMVVEIGLDGEARYFVGLKGGVRKICFHGEQMLVTGAEKAIRSWSL